VAARVKKYTNLQEVLAGFFSERDISELKKNIFNNSFPRNENLKFKPSDQKQIDVDISDSYLKEFQFQIIITLAEQKLNKTRYIEFLLTFGDYAISLGENEFAIETHKRILNESKSDINFKNLAANASYSIGEIYSREAKWIESFEYIKRAFNLFKQQNDIKGCAKCENLLGTVYGERGDLKEAANHFEESLRYLDEKKDAVLIGKIEINLGIINNIYSNYDQALFYYNRALINFQRLNDHHKLAQIRHNIGITYLKKKEYVRALKELDKSIAISLNDSIYSILGISYITKAFIFAQMEDVELSKAFADKAMEICYKTNDKLSVAEIYKVEGMIKRVQKNYSVAENYLHTSLRINKEYKNLLNRAETSLELGILYKEWMKPDKANSCFNDALRYFKKIKAVHEIENIEQHLAG
jgi:tetratricopeptide (TPR) repeat protein